MGNLQVRRGRARSGPGQIPRPFHAGQPGRSVLHRPAPSTQVSPSHIHQSLPHRSVRLGQSRYKEWPYPAPPKHHGEELTLPFRQTRLEPVRVGHIRDRPPRRSAHQRGLTSRDATVTRALFLRAYPCCVCSYEQLCRQTERDLPVDRCRTSTRPSSSAAAIC